MYYIDVEWVTTLPALGDFTRPGHLRPGNYNLINHITGVNRNIVLFIYIYIYIPQKPAALVEGRLSPCCFDFK